MTLDEITELRKKYYNATLAKIFEPKEGLWRVQVQTDSPPPSYKPGQYTTLGLGAWEPRHPNAQVETLDPAKQNKLLRRAYSISHPILDPKTGKLLAADSLQVYEFYITLVLKGEDPQKPPAFTPRLFLLKEGDRLAFGPKVTGHYTLESIDLSSEPTLLFLATGTGEAPHNAMIWNLLNKGYKGKMVSVVSTRYAAEQAYAETHRQLENMFSNYHYMTLATREQTGSKKHIQHLVMEGGIEEKAGFKLTPDKVHVLLCGNPAMIGIPKTENGQKTYPVPQGIIEILESKGFAMHTLQQKGNIHFESYW